MRPNEKEPDPDGLEDAARKELEESAIASILECESNWERTPTHNRGYDLYQVDQDGNKIRCVKSRR